MKYKRLSFYMKKVFAACAGLACLVLESSEHSLPGVVLPVVPGSSQQILCGASQTSLPEIPLLEPEFKLQFLKDFFKVRIRVPLLPGYQPECSGKGNDDARIFIRDTAEFLISTDPLSGVYYHIGVNPENFCYTARKRDISWNPAVKTTVKKEKNAWIAEIIIPYKEINASYPREGTVWKMNLAATVPMADGKKSVSWSGAYDYHLIREMGTLRFRREQVPHLAFWNTGNNCFSAELHVPVKYADARVSCLIDGIEYPGKRSGSCYLWKIPLTGDTVNGKDFHRIVISVTGRNNQILFQKHGIAKIQKRHTFELDSFYYKPAQKEIRYTHDLPLPARILLRRSNGEIVFHGSAEKKNGSIILPETGEYIFEISSGKVRTSRYLRVVPADFGVEKIAESSRFEIRSGTFILAEKPVFLIGASTAPQWHLQFSPAFNLRAGNGGNQKNSIHMPGTGLFKLERKPYTRYQLRPEAREKLFKRNLTSAGNRDVIRLAYEGQIQITTGDDPRNPVKIDNTAFFKSLYRQLKDKNPGTYFSLHTDRESFRESFAGIADVFEFASWHSSYALDMMLNIERDMGGAVYSAGGKPVIFWLGGSIPDGKCRTAEELRAAVYMAVVLNCRGVIFHMGHGGVKSSRRRLWSLISGITAEIQAFYPRFSAGTEAKDFVISCMGDFLYSARQNKDGICLVIINRQGREQKLQMNTRNGMLQDRFTAFEPKVYFLASKR